MKINYIKSCYNLKEVQDSLRLDSLDIFCKNMSNNHKIYSGNDMSKKKIKEYVKYFHKKMIELNEVKEWNQTG